MTVGPLSVTTYEFADASGNVVASIDAVGIVTRTYFDVLNRPLSTRSLVVAPTDYSVASVRFVNAIGNANPLTLYARNTADTTKPAVAVGAAVAYKGVGAFAPLPAGVYDLFARFTDSTANKITSRGVSFFGGRVYSVSARGDITITDSTATRRPILDNTANR